jgi:hypothetical protein
MPKEKTLTICQNKECTLEKQKLDSIKSKIITKLDSDFKKADPKNFNKIQDEYTETMRQLLLSKESLNIINCSIKNCNENTKDFLKDFLKLIDHNCKYMYSKDRCGDNLVKLKKLVNNNEYSEKEYIEILMKLWNWPKKVK